MFLRMLHNDMCIGASTCNALLHYKVSVGVLAIKMSSRLSGGSSCVISLLSTVVFDITWGGPGERGLEGFGREWRWHRWLIICKLGGR